MAKKKERPLVGIGEPWLITEAGLSDIISKQDAGLEAVMSKQPDQTKTEILSIRDGVAIINVAGPILRYGGGFLSYFFQISSIEDIGQDFSAAVEDPMVDAIVLNIDSPGGQVSGTNELADLIYGARGKKPIVAYANNTAASAAYWIASAADRIVIDATSAVGSIGVVAGYRKADPGVVEIVSSNSPKKRVDPESDAGKAEILKTVDAIAEVFVDRVARNRGVDVETVLAQYGQGGVIVGAAAVEAGLADEIGSLEDVLGGFKQKSGGFNMKKFTTEQLAEALDQIKADAPGMLNDIRDEAKVTGDIEGVERGRIEGQAAERARVMDILSADADPAATRKAIEDGVESSAAFKMFYEAERSKRAEGLKNLKLEATPPVGVTPPEPSAKSFDALVAEYQSEKKCSKGIAMQAVMKADPQAHKTWLAEKQAK